MSIAQVGEFRSAVLVQCGILKPSPAGGVCDVVIPVYEQPQWVALCIAELVRNTAPEVLGSVFLVDDASSSSTRKELEALAARYPAVRILSQDVRGGFARAVNCGIEKTTAPYVLLLNTDCLLTKDAIRKLIGHCQSDDTVGLVSPFSNNSPPLTLPMFEGSSYVWMNELLERACPAEHVPACTMVGNALLVTRACLERTGLFDTAYGLGYGEDTDYQFRAMEKGFNAVAALDTYVYHHGAESFRADQQSLTRAKEEGRSRFFSRWRKEYDDLARRVFPDAPLRRVIEATTTATQSPPQCDLLFVLPNLDQKVGGCHSVAAICNFAVRAGLRVQIASLMARKCASWNEPLYLEPLFYRSEEEFARETRLRPRRVIATAWHTFVPARFFAESLGIPCDYLVQGYEFYFHRGSSYGAVADTFHAAERVLTTSRWLKDMVGTHFAGPIEVLPIGFDEGLFNTAGRVEQAKPRLTLALRGSLDKGQPFLLELLHRLAGHADRLELTVLARETVVLPPEWDGRCEIRKLPLASAQIAAILKKTDIYIDGSLHEGFGLMPLQALACGCAVIAADSGGVAEFLRDGENGFLVVEVNRPECFAEKFEFLLDHPEVVESFRRRVEDRRDLSQERCLPVWIEYLTNAVRDEPAPARRRPLEARSWLLWQETLKRLREGEPATPPMEARLAVVEERLSEIRASRIWRVLCWCGDVLLRLGALPRSFVEIPRRGSAKTREK